MAGETQTRAHVLVVDDCRTVLALTEHLLKDAGYEVITCENPILVPALIFREKIDVVLLDLQMPGLTGEWVAQTVGQESRSGQAKIIFHSSEPEKRLAELVESTGAAAYFQKSDDTAGLLALIDRVLAQEETP